jgi:hypothetical protein
MTTLNDATNFSMHLQPLADVIRAAAVECGHPWIVAVLDVRYSDREKSFIDKIRVERTDGSVVSVNLSNDGTLRLISLGNARPTGSDRWYGLILRVTVEGTFEARLNYDPAYAEDQTFYDS